MTDRPDWNDEPMDVRLRDLAKEYNRPSGVVPREAMWQAIAPAVRAAARTADVTPDIAPSTTRKRRHIAPYAWSTALAAGLVLGIMLEREVIAPHAGSPVAGTLPVTDSRQVATSTPIPANAGPATTAPAPEATRVAAASRQAEQATTSSTRARDGRAASGRGTTSVDADAGRHATDAQQLYRLAARQTLVQAEALLTAYRASDDQPRDQESMQQAGRWARDVLTSTRLLLDSPAGNDPQMRALFTDLELVLAQIVQLSGAPLQAGERELIERAMRDRDLLPRLRSALPAGATTE
ncbi:MAG TPA: hypothetical protein VF034_14740 [Gemmatimonadaceae bacterium]|jgi:hypothetical protein